VSRQTGAWASCLVVAVVLIFLGMPEHAFPFIAASFVILALPEDKK
jgi:hypothetical protein